MHCAGWDCDEDVLGLGWLGDFNVLGGTGGRGCFSRSVLKVSDSRDCLTCTLATQGGGGGVLDMRGCGLATMTETFSVLVSVLIADPLDCAGALDVLGLGSISETGTVTDSFWTTTSFSHS